MLRLAAWSSTMSIRVECMSVARGACTTLESASSGTEKKNVEPLPGVIFFGLTVVLTMFASLSFDPRLTWDDEEPHD